MTSNDGLDDAFEHSTGKPQPRMLKRAKAKCSAKRKRLPAVLSFKKLSDRAMKLALPPG